VEQIPSTVAVEYILNEDARKNDELMAILPPGSLVINATGMGKDRPGSPISDNGLFPERGIAWELNYRGVLGFLHQAHVQERQRSLRVVDGWYYFIISWADIIARVFDSSVSPAQLDQLATIADEMRT